MDARVEIKQGLMLLAQLAAESDSDADHRNRVTASVSRYLREAKALIYNVGEGRFPDMTPPPKP